MHAYDRRSSLIIGIALLILAALLAVVGTHVLAGHASAEAIAWDKSSLDLTGQCLTDGRAEFTVTNTGRDMDGPTSWREYEADALTTQGAVILAANESYTWTFGPLSGVPIRFEIDQRPGHPGNSHPALTLTCAQPNAVTLRTFTATSGGNGGGCAAGNQWRGLACTVTDARPGYVSGTCQWGLWFANVRTARTFVIGQSVTVQGCEYLRGRLGGATNWPLRISKG